MVPANRDFLVVGGDSLVGAALFKAIGSRGHSVFATTRRYDTVDNRRVYLDFEDKKKFCPPPSVGYVFIVAAATNYGRCENDPLAHSINVVLIPGLIASLLEQGHFVTFISTNSLFGGERPWPHEDAPHAPGIAYARQKSDAEWSIKAEARRLRAESRLNIVRLTKILSRSTPPLPEWFACWNHGEAVHPFSDLIFSPMSVRFVSEALAVIGEKRIPGDLHLSGAENVSYVDLAIRLADKMGVDSQQIIPTTATERNVHIPFKPAYSGLGMQRTTLMSGILPQTLDEVVSDLVAENSP